MGDAQLMRVTPTEAGEHGLARADALGGEVGRSAELAVAQLEAQARATVNARFFMAAKMRRTWDDVEQRLIRECQRPRFAASAWYVKPIGRDEAKWPRGLSIRFAEAALRVSGNIDIQIQTVFDDDWKRVVRISVMDLESNFGYTKEVSIDKTVERKFIDNNREVLSVRQNSSGQSTYLVRATEDEVMVKQNALVSKEIRTQGLRLIPGDILDECKAVIQATIQKGASAEDPEAARKAVLDNFITVGVAAGDLAKYLEHDTDKLLPAEVVTLRGIFVAIKNGDVTWKDVMQAKFGAGDGEESEAAKKLKEQLAKKTKAAAGPAPKPEAPTPAAEKQAPAAQQSSPAAKEDPPPPIRRYAHGEMPDAMECRVGLEAYHDGEHFRVEADGDLQRWIMVGKAPQEPPVEDEALVSKPSGNKGRGRNANAFDFEKK